MHLHSSRNLKALAGPRLENKEVQFRVHPSPKSPEDLTEG